MANAIEVKVPDIGDFKNIPVIEILVKPGDTVRAEDPLVTLESDKATMEVPSPAAGTVKEIRIKVGDKVSEGALVLMLEAGAEAPAAAAKAAPAAPVAPVAAAAQPAKPAAVAAAKPAPAAAPAVVPVNEAGFGKAHASPSVRRFARELGVDLPRVKGSGPKDRVTKEDVQAFVKTELSKPRGAEGGGAGDVGLQLLSAEILGGGGEGDEGHALVVVDGLGVEMHVGHLEGQTGTGGGAAHRLADAPAALLRQEILLLQFHGMCLVRAD